MQDTTTFNFDNSFARELEGFYVPWQGEKTPEPEVLRFNHELAETLGIDGKSLDSDEGAKILTGEVEPEGGSPLAMVYAGHQFGGFSAQLGDGRALLIGEVLDQDGKRKDIQLKGSGRTPFSRNGDGKAVLGPVLREYLMGEAMHALGIPTTRGLAVTLTGEKIYRNSLEKGAILTRVAASHIRVGTFQFFAARQQTDKVRQLADYAINRHYPELALREDRYLELFKKVRDAQAALIAKWMMIGFVHGVMNTDNMTISGETIDYGPCAFIDHYDAKAVFSSIDEQGRYAYGNQPVMGQWNLARFAESLAGIIVPDDSEESVRLLVEALEEFPALYQAEWFKGMREKFGLSTEEEGDLELVNSLFTVMDDQNVDYTKIFRALAKAVGGVKEPARSLFKNPEAGFDDWLDSYLARMEKDPRSAQDIVADMDKVNPVYIPRNHKVEEALEAAAEGDMQPFDSLLSVMQNPFEEQEGAEIYAEPAPRDFGNYVTFCGT